MSYSRCLSLSALLASTFITPVAAMDLTLLSPNNNAILEYTHTNTPVPEPASFSFSEQAYKIAAICFLGYGNCDNEISYGKGDETYNMDTANQCKNEGFVSTCSSGYCLDGSCSYNASYGKCIAENCPTNSSPTCTGAVVGKTACGGDCKQCCSDTCTSGSKSYTGSYASTTECGTKCYYCNTSCSSGSTSYSGSVIGYNECGSACRSCSDTCTSGSKSSSCDSGYTASTVSSTECGSTCYSCVKDDPCDNYTSKTCTYGCSEYYSDCSSKCKTCKSCSDTCSSGFKSHPDYIGATCNSGYGLNVQVGTTECGSVCLECDSCANSSSKGVACNGPNDHCTQTGTCGVCTECTTCGCNSSDSWGYYTYSGGSNCTKINQAANFESACGSCYYCRY